MVLVGLMLMLTQDVSKLLVVKKTRSWLAPVNPTLVPVLVPLFWLNGNSGNLFQAGVESK